MTPQGENGKFLREGVRKMRLFLIDEKVQVETEGSLDENRLTYRMRQDALEIGMADVQQGINGGLTIELFIAGEWTDPDIMSESLIMKGFIRAEMRKD